jgi:hypothetical protein
MPQREQTGVGHDLAAIGAGGDLLFAEVPEGKVVGIVCGPEPEPPGYSKWMYRYYLDDPRGSFFQQMVRYSG